MHDTVCRHRLVPVAGISVVACAACGLVQFWDHTRPLDPASGMELLFGEFPMQGHVRTLGGPGRDALLYEPPSEEARRHLDAFPTGVWLRAHEELWMSHDGTTLLLSPVDPAVSGRLRHGA